MSHGEFSPVIEFRRRDDAVTPAPGGGRGAGRVCPLEQRTASAGSMIRLEAVSKVFGSGDAAVAAIAEVTLDIPSGTSTLVRGPTGCGKTTLLSLVGCLMRPTSGRIRIGGIETTKMHEDLLAQLRRGRIGFVFQGVNLIRGASALVNVMVPSIPGSTSNARLRETAAGLLISLGLGKLMNRRVELLSGGEQQRVALARALLNAPDILIADEPTAHQDAAAKEFFFEILDQLVADGKTAIVASHDDAVPKIHRFSRTIELTGGRIAT